MKKGFGFRLSKNKFLLFTIAISVLKLIFAAIFSSDYQDKMFIPFVQTFFRNFGSTNWNVYQYYFSHEFVQSFPYPPLMLLIECVGNFLIAILSLIGIQSVFLSNFLFKMPVVAFDFLIFFILLKFFPDRRRYVGALYFASPIILYSTYMHGQLDVIPTALLLFSLFKLKRIGGHNCNYSAVLFAFAFLTKTHILAALPLVLLFVLRRYGHVAMARYVAIVLLVSVLGIFPFMSEGFIHTVFMNNEQNVLTQFFVMIGSIKIFMPILAVLIVYLIACGIRTISDELLIFICGIIFMLFLALCQPMPGWFVWIVPFIVMFVTVVPYGRYNNIFAYVFLNFFYCIYFIFLHQSKSIDLILLGNPLDFIKIYNHGLTNVCFTCMAGILFYLIWQMYSFGISMNSLYKMGTRPFTIGISGDSGSGKTHFVEIMEKVLGIKNLQCLEGDGDHRWERGEKIWEDITHLNPNANYLYRQAQNLISLHSGLSVLRSEYNHATGKFSESKKIKAKKYVFLCGLHSLYLPQTRSHLDLKIYIDTEERLRRFWKIKRDVQERGADLESVLTSIETRIDDAQKYIYPQKEYADIIVRYFDPSLRDCTDIEYVPHISLEIICGAEIDLEPLVNILSQYGISACHEFTQSLEKQSLAINSADMENNIIDLNDVISFLVPAIDEITVENFERFDTLQGILALIILMFIDKKIRSGGNNG